MINLETYSGSGENHCSGCENNCCDHFKLFWPQERIDQLIAEYPFFKVSGSGVAMINGREKVYRILECARLQEDGSCKDYPVGRPSFCETTGVISRPAIKCLLNDFINRKQENG